MNKADQRIFLFSLAALAVGGLALKYGRDLPVVSDIAEGYGA